MDKRMRIGRFFPLTEVQLERNQWRVERAPLATDIYWNHLGTSKLSFKLPKIFVNTCLLLLLLFLSSPLALISALQSVGRIINAEAVDIAQSWGVLAAKLELDRCYILPVLVQRSCVCEHVYTHALAFLITCTFLGISFDLLAPIPWIKKKIKKFRKNDMLQLVPENEDYPLASNSLRRSLISEKAYMAFENGGGMNVIDLWCMIFLYILLAELDKSQNRSSTLHYIMHST